MAGVAKKTKKTVTRSRSKRTITPMTKAEMFKKILADRQIIREALLKGIPLEELEKTHGFKFAVLPDPKNW